jgi:hypothetical protein
MRQRILGPEHPHTLISMGNLGSTYSNQGKWKKAEMLQTQVLEMTQRILGPEHPDTLTSMQYLGLTYSNQGKWKEAEMLQAPVLEMKQRILKGHLAPEPPCSQGAAYNAPSHHPKRKVALKY